MEAIRAIWKIVSPYRITFWYCVIGMGGRVVTAPACDAKGYGFDPGCPSNFCYFIIVGRRTRHNVIMTSF